VPNNGDCREPRFPEDRFATNALHIRSIEERFVFLSFFFSLPLNGAVNARLKSL